MKISIRTLKKEIKLYESFIKTSGLNTAQLSETTSQLDDFKRAVKILEYTPDQTAKFLNEEFSTDIMPLLFIAIHRWHYQQTMELNAVTEGMSFTDKDVAQNGVDSALKLLTWYKELKESLT